MSPRRHPPPRRRRVTAPASPHQHHRPLRHLRPFRQRVPILQDPHIDPRRLLTPVETPIPLRTRALPRIHTNAPRRSYTASRWISTGTDGGTRKTSFRPSPFGVNAPGIANYRTRPRPPSAVATHPFVVTTVNRYVSSTFRRRDRIRRSRGCPTRSPDSIDRTQLFRDDRVQM
jgi:hypothetical protein